MIHPRPSLPRRFRAGALPLLALACGGLAACGSSSTTTNTAADAAATTSSSAAASSTATPNTAATGNASAGGTSPSGHTSSTGSNTKATGGSVSSASGAGAALGKGRSSSTHFRQALIVFADCLRHNGIPIPQPNTTGKGPVFDTRGLDTASPKFRQARQKCRSTLLSALRAAAHRGTR